MNGPKTRGVFVAVRDLAQAKAQMETKRVPNGHTWPCELIDEKPDGIFNTHRVRVEVVSWSAWIGMHVPAKQIATVPIRWVTEATRYKRPQDQEYGETDTLVVLVTLGDWLDECSRQLTNLSSSLSSTINSVVRDGVLR